MSTASLNSAKRMGDATVVRVRDRQSGAGTVEYVGMVVVVGLLVAGLMMALPSIGDRVACEFSQAVAEIAGGSADCSGGTPKARGR